MTAGLQATGSRSTPNPLSVADDERIEPDRDRCSAASSASSNLSALAHPPPEICRRHLGVVFVSNVDALLVEACGARRCDWTATRCELGIGPRPSKTDARRRCHGGSRSPCACGRSHACPPSPKAERMGNLLGQADPLVDFDPFTGSGDADLASPCRKPRDHRGFLRRGKISTA